MWELPCNGNGVKQGLFWASTSSVRAHRLQGMSPVARCSPPHCPRHLGWALRPACPPGRTAETRNLWLQRFCKMAAALLSASAQLFWHHAWPPARLLRPGPERQGRRPGHPPAELYLMSAMQPCSTLGPNPLIFRAKLMIQSSLLRKFLKTRHSVGFFPSPPAPKWFDGQRSTQSRQGTLAEYCHALINLPHKISRCPHVISFFKVRPNDTNPVTDSQ